MFFGFNTWVKKKKKIILIHLISHDFTCYISKCGYITNCGYLLMYVYTYMVCGVRQYLHLKISLR